MKNKYKSFYKCGRLTRLSARAGTISSLIENYMIELLGALFSILVIERIWHLYEEARHKEEAEPSHQLTLEIVLLSMGEMKKRLFNIWANLDYVLEKEDYNAIKTDVEELEYLNNKMLQTSSMQNEILSYDVKSKIVDIYDRVSRRTMELKSYLTNISKPMVVIHRARAQPPNIMYIEPNYVESMNKTVFVLGAGCSKNYEIGRKPSVDNLEVPTDASFFNVCSKLFLSIDEYISGVPNENYRLISQILDLFLREKEKGRTSGYTDTSLSIHGWPPLELRRKDCRVLSEIGLSLERVFTIIETGVSTGHIDRRCRDQFTELIAITLHESLQGDICILHAELVNQLERDDTIISFNYDTLIDEALFSSSIQFNENGYNIPFSFIYNGIEYRRPSLKRSQIKLLKLHGSLNWIACSRCEAIFLMRTKQGLQSLESYKNICCPICGQISSGDIKHIFKKNSFTKMIIPPIMHKGLNVKPYKSLWDIAYDALENADRIVIIGYRMSPIDFHSESLFRNAARNKIIKNRSDYSLSIVNPTFSELRERFSNIFNTNDVKGYADLRSFLKEN